VLLLIIVYSVASPSMPKLQSIQCQHLASLDRCLALRGGAKKLSIGAILKAFWLTLIDPSNEEGLKQSKSLDAKKKTKGGFFSYKPKGRKLG
jgi:hypothetical protein